MVFLLIFLRLRYKGDRGWLNDLLAYLRKPLQLRKLFSVNDRIVMNTALEKIWKKATMPQRFGTGSSPVAGLC